MSECVGVYKGANGKLRRLMNQAFFEKLYLLDDRIAGADLRRPIQDLLGDDLTERLG
ncbi:MAG: hypothetical protein ACR2ME_03040 [Acidimicrobiia bacterium]